MVDKAEFLKEQLNKSPDESKKARMARVGLWGIAAFFLAGILLMFVKPDTAAHVVLLVQIAIGSWTGIVMLYLGAQGSVDYKTTQVLGNTIEKREEHITITEKYDPLVEKKYADKYVADESYRPPATVPNYEGKDFR